MNRPALLVKSPVRLLPALVSLLLLVPGLRSPAATVPLILEQPAEVTASPGDAVTLRVKALGPSLSYRWEKLTGKNLHIAQEVGNRETLTFSNLHPTNAGTYRVRVSAPGFGSTLSRLVTVSFPGDEGTDRLTTARLGGRARAGLPVGRGVVMNGKFYYPGYDPEHGTELWVTDGTPAGTRLVHDLHPGEGDGLVVPLGASAGLGVFKGRLYFVGQPFPSQRGVWVSDGTPEGTQLLRDAFEFVTAEGSDSLFNGIVEIERTPVVLDTGSTLDLREFTIAGDLLYFVVQGGGRRALGRTDGTPAGTFTLHLQGASLDQEWLETLSLSSLLADAGRLLFVARTPKYGSSLWSTDGTQNGTELALNLSTAPFVSASSDDVLGVLRRANDRIFASASLAVVSSNAVQHLGFEPAVLNSGSYSNLLDLYPGPESSLPYDFTALRGRTYFAAREPDGMALWSTDGTGAGTTRTRLIGAGVSRLRAAVPLVGAGRLFFMGRTEETGFELWTSDGTTEGTRLVADLAPGAESSLPQPLANAGGSLYFITEAPADARALWISDGTAGGTQALTPPTDLLDHALLRDGAATYFAGQKTAGGRSIVVYRTEGTTATTTPLFELPYARESALQWADLGARKILNTQGARAPGLQVGELVVTDGTPAGTTSLALPEVPDSFGTFLPFKGGLLYTAMVSLQEAALFHWDGAVSRTLKIYPADSARCIGAVGDQHALLAPETPFWQQHGLILTDGTPEGTVSKPFTYLPGNLFGIEAIGDTFIVSGGLQGLVDEILGLSTDSPGVRNPGLYRVPSSGPISLLKNHFNSDLPPSYLTRLGNEVFYFGFSPSGPGLWKTDGTAQGTRLVEPLPSGEWTRYPFEPAWRPAVFGNRLFFNAASEFPEVGRELWKSSGTTLGTVLLKDLYPGIAELFSDSDWFGLEMITGYRLGQGDPAELTPVGNQLFFTAMSQQGRELWKTDGTFPGTVQVGNLRTGDEGTGLPMAAPTLGSPLSFTLFPPSPATNLARPTNLVAVGNHLYFVASTTDGTRIHRSDGTAAGTVVVDSPASNLSAPRELTSVNGRLYYTRGPLFSRRQLWEYDPATATHRVLTDLAGGVPSPARLTAVGQRLFFLGNDGSRQRLMIYDRQPLIRVHPADQTLVEGTSAELSVEMAAVPGLAYQWRRSAGKLITAQLGTTPTLTVAASNVSSQAYSVRVTSPQGAMNSRPAHLTVLDAQLSKLIRENPTSWWDQLPGETLTPQLGDPGTLDASWGTNLPLSGQITKILPLEDGGVLLAGSFSLNGGTTSPGIARLDDEGQPDPGFNPGAGAAGGIVDAALRADGRILVAGNFLTFDGYQRPRVARLHGNGTVDLTFKPVVGAAVQQVLAVLPAANDQVYVGGVFEQWDGHPTVSVVRLNADGTVDTTFTVSNQPNTGGPFRVAALAFYPDATSPQHLLVGGGTYFVEPGNGISNQRRHLARLQAGTGAWDPSFNLTPIPTPPGSIDGSLSQIVPLDTGRLLVAGVQGGGHTTYDGLLRLGPTGTLDLGFTAGPTFGGLGPSVAAAPFRAIALTPGGKIVAGGRFHGVQGLGRSNLVQLLPDGQVDAGFGSAPGPNNEVSAVAVLPDGGILIAGAFTQVDGVARPGLARIHGDPAPPTYLGPPLVQVPAIPLLNLETLTLSVKVTGSPRPTVTWYRGDTVVGTGPRLVVNRTDPQNAGDYYAVVSNGRGSFTTDSTRVEVPTAVPTLLTPPADVAVSRGGLASFAAHATGAPPLAYQWRRNGQPLAGETNPVLRVRIAAFAGEEDGYSVTVSNRFGWVSSAPARARVTLEGTFDACFFDEAVPAGTASSFVSCDPPGPGEFASFRSASVVAYQPNGHLILGGNSAFTRGGAFSAAPPTYLMRFTAWGERAFDGAAQPDGAVQVIACGDDSSVYLAGTFLNVVDASGKVLAPRPGFAKFDANLHWVSEFNPALLPAGARVTAIRVQPDGKVLIAGTFTSVNGVPSLGIARLLPNGTNDPNFRSGLTFLQHAVPKAIALLDDGRILLGGQGAYYGAGAPPAGEYRNQLCRLNPDGSWDPTFETAGGAGPAGYIESVDQILVQPDQRLLISGNLARWGSTPRAGLARLHPDGALDASFDPGPGLNAGVRSMVPADSGGLYVGGSFTRFGTTEVGRVVRLHADGRLDEGFATGPMDLVTGLASLPDGGVIVVGSFATPAQTPPLGEAREAGTQEWRHPLTAVLHNLRVMEQEVDCEGRERVVRNAYADRCGEPFAVMNGVARLRGPAAVPGAPVLLEQPRSVAVLGGTRSVSLRVKARAGSAGTEGLTYQWLKDGTPIPNATRSTLNLDALTRAQEGAYSVIISNTLGVATSDVAEVKIVATADATGRPRVVPEERRFEWTFSPAAGATLTADDLEKLDLQTSEDLRTWVTVPNAARLVDGKAVLTDPSAVAGKKFYRFAPRRPARPPSAVAAASTLTPLSTVPAPVLARVQRHLLAFADERGRGGADAPWTGASIAPEARLVFDPAHDDGNTPAYAELAVVAGGEPRGYILVSLTEDDRPIVEFATEGEPKTARLLKEASGGTVTRFMRLTRGFLAGESADGTPVATLGTAPLRPLSPTPSNPAKSYRGGFDSATGAALNTVALQADWVPYESYAAMKAGVRTDPLRIAARQLRAADAASRWKLVRGERNPRLLLPASETRVFLEGEPLASVEVLDEIDGAGGVVAVRVRPEGGFTATGLGEGRAVIRVVRRDGRIERHTLVVSGPGPARADAPCNGTEKETWVAGLGFNEDQPRYGQMSDENHPNWCPAVGCGPTALAMLFAWWDMNAGVPSVFYTLDSGRGQLDSFRFNEQSLKTSDAPRTFDEPGGKAKVKALYEDLHELCNTVCLGSSGATAPDQMVSAFFEYLSRVFMPQPGASGEYGGPFIQFTVDRSYVWPGGLTDWEGGGKMVAAGIKQGRPGIVGLDWHYALAYAYKRIKHYEDCELEDTEHWFRLNMGWQNTAEWHDATDVWFGLTSEFWQITPPEPPATPLPLPTLPAYLGNGPNSEVPRPAAALTANGTEIRLLAGDPQGDVPTLFRRFTSKNAGVSFTTPLNSAIGEGAFRSGPALVASADGLQLRAYGQGTDRGIWEARSFNGGTTWPVAWTPIGTGQYLAAPAAAASSNLSLIHLVVKSTSDTYLLQTSSNSAPWGPLWKPLQGAFKSAPAAAVSADGRRLYVFGRGTDRRLWYGYTSDASNPGTPFAGWNPIHQGTFTSAPAAVVTPDGNRIHVFGRGDDRRIYQSVSTDGALTWSDWQAVGDGVFSSGPAAVMAADGQRIHLFGRGVTPGVSSSDPAVPYVWRAFSPDAGATWPVAWGPIQPVSE